MTFPSRRAWVAPLVSGALLVLAYPPFSVPLIPFVGLVPLFWFFCTPRTVRQVLGGATAFTLPYYVGNLYWLFYLAGFTVAGIAAGAVTLVLHFLSFLLFAVGMNVLNHAARLPLALTAPLLWTLTEHARAQGELAFPWVTLGYSLSEWPLLAQHADLVGVYGLSWWLALINALVLALWSGRRRRSSLSWPASLLIAASVLPLAYDLVRWRQVDDELEEAATLRVAVVQPNIPQRLKWDSAARDANLARLNRLVKQAGRSDPDLIVGPEACLPMITSTEDPRLPDEISQGEHPVLFGVVRGVGQPERVRTADGTHWRYREHFNSAVLAAPDRTALGAYDKHYLVPVSEQIPYKRVFAFLLPFMRKQFGRIVPGRDLEPLALTGPTPPVRFGVLICYESLFTELVREMVEREARLVVLLTNDAWFGRSSMSYQHLAQSVLRAIEFRRSVVVAANTGISGYVDPLGRPQVRTSIFEEAVFHEPVVLLSRRTVYARTGELVVYVGYAIAAGVFVVAARARRRQRPTGPA